MEIDRLGGKSADNARGKGHVSQLFKEKSSAISPFEKKVSFKESGHFREDQEESAERRSPGIYIKRLSKPDESD